MSQQSSEYSEILCHLHLFAVLPALDDLLKNVPEARRILGNRNFTISISVKNGPKAIFSIGEGRCLLNESRPHEAGIHFFFQSSNHLNRLLQGRPVLPGIEFKTWSPDSLITFLRLLNLLRKYLRPRELLSNDANFRDNHVRLLLGIAFFGLRQLAELEEVSQRRMLEVPSGLALFTIDGGDLAAWAQWNGHHITAGKGIPDTQPDVKISFKNAEVAYLALSERLDPMASVGLQQIKAEGLLPLADALSFIIERIPRYLTV